MEMMHGASMLSRPADEFGNDSMVEEMWAAKALEHAEVHFNLLTSVNPSQLRLTPYDDQIYETFRQDFPDLKVGLLTDDVLKSAGEKLKWREFAEKFNKMDDYSYGTLMRADASKEFSPDNSIFVFRVQFLAIEIARNREGLNDEVHAKHRPAKKNPQEDNK
ncbi:protein PBDC1 isoform X1 [Drosophila guanche]|uniref:Blast:Protein PBDC1 n=1 Tax=Drosophila guanche TaxID=7266 RepID=A0A3B0JWN2_DROGU|nr:protein PBDC1 isoform X1 [Drosophila guanche]SPP77131.1 blast:Protein PBDC1 [Drosophila guanche]